MKVSVIDTEHVNTLFWFILFLIMNHIYQKRSNIPPQDKEQRVALTGLNDIALDVTGEGRDPQVTGHRSQTMENTYLM